MKRTRTYLLLLFLCISAPAVRAQTGFFNFGMQYAVTAIPDTRFLLPARYLPFTLQAGGGSERFQVLAEYTFSDLFGFSRPTFRYEESGEQYFEQYAEHYLGAGIRLNILAVNSDPYDGFFTWYSKVTAGPLFTRARLLDADMEVLRKGPVQTGLRVGVGPGITVRLAYGVRIYGELLQNFNFYRKVNQEVFHYREPVWALGMHFGF